MGQPLLIKEMNLLHIIGNFGSGGIFFNFIFREKIFFPVFQVDHTIIIKISDETKKVSILQYKKVVYLNISFVRAKVVSEISLESLITGDMI